MVLSGVEAYTYYRRGQMTEEIYEGPRDTSPSLGGKTSSICVHLQRAISHQLPRSQLRLAN